MENKFHNIPVLGVGISYREHFHKTITNYYNQIDFLEVIADRYLYSIANNQIYKRDIAILNELFPIIPHGVNLSIGSAEGLDNEYVKNLTKLAKVVNAPWISEHLCFTRANGIDFGHLTPLPFTFEAIETVLNNLKQLQQHIEQPIILENITYPFKVPGSQLSELQFIKEIVTESQCGILFDVTNLYANSQNQKYDPYEFINGFPLEHIVQLHFTGGYWYKNEYIDSHTQKTPEEVWILLEEVVKLAPIKGIILERDDNDAPLEELIEEVERARDIGRKYNRWR